MHFLKQIQINNSYADIGRAACLGVAKSLNFSIINLVGQHIRRRTREIIALEAKEGAKIDTGYLGMNPENILDGIDGLNESLKGTTLAPDEFGETRTPEGEQSDGAEVTDSTDQDEAARTEQGHPVKEKPLTTAAKLMVVRLYVADHLAAHARFDEEYNSTRPYDLCPPFDVEMERQLKPRKIDHVRLKAEAASKGLPFDDVLRIRERENAFQLAFVQNNAKSILDMISGLQAVDSDGVHLGIDDAEDVFDDLEPSMKMRLLVAADQGLWFYRDRVISAGLRGLPDADTNRKLVAGARDELRLRYDLMLTDRKFYDKLVEASLNGSKWPVLQPAESDIDPEWDKRRLAQQKAQREKVDELRKHFAKA